MTHQDIRFGGQAQSGDEQWQRWMRDAGIPFELVTSCPNPQCLVCRPAGDQPVPAAAA